MIHCILTDIEGTTSSIDFVHKVLFPYSRMRMSAFLLTQNVKDPQVGELVKRLWVEDLKQSPDEKPDMNQVSALLVDMIDKDLKHPILKELQGKIWKSGFERNDFKGHVYE